MLNEIEGCYFIGRHGLFRVFCPFKVLCLKDIHELIQGEDLQVSAVKSTKNGSIVYEINGNYYFHHYFILEN